MSYLVFDVLMTLIDDKKDTINSSKRISLKDPIKSRKKPIESGVGDLVTKYKEGASLHIKARCKKYNLAATATTPGAFGCMLTKKSYDKTSQRITPSAIEAALYNSDCNLTESGATKNTEPPKKSTLKKEALQKALNNARPTTNRHKNSACQTQFAENVKQRRATANSKSRSKQLII